MMEGNKKDQQILEDTVLQLNEELEEALQKVTRVEAVLKLAEDKAVQLETKIKKQDAEIQDLEDALTNAPPLKDMLALKDKITQLQGDNTLFKNKLEQEERRVESCQSHTLLLSTTCDQLKEELAAAKETEDSCNSKIEELEHTLIIAQEEKKLLEDMYTQDTEGLNSEIDMLKLAKSTSDRKISESSNNQEHEVHTLKNELLKLTEALERTNDQITNYKQENDELHAKLQQQSDALLVLRQNEALDLSQQHNAISFLQSGSRDKHQLVTSHSEESVRQEREIYLSEMERLKAKLRERKSMLKKRGDEMDALKASYESELNHYRVKADLRKWRLNRSGGGSPDVSLTTEDLSRSKEGQLQQRETQIQQREGQMHQREGQLQAKLSEMNLQASQREVTHQSQLVELERQSKQREAAYRSQVIQLEHALGLLQEEKGLLEELYAEDTQKLQRELILVKTASSSKKRSLSDSLQGELLKAQHENIALQDAITELEGQMNSLQLHFKEHEETLEQKGSDDFEEYDTHIKYLTKRVEELKLTDLAQRAKIEDLVNSASQKDSLVAQLSDNVTALHDTIKGLTQRVAKMDGEARDYNAQQFSVRDLERKYAEAIVQLNSLQSVHKQTVDIFEKEKLVFKTTAQQLAGIAGTAERDGTLMSARLSAAKRHIQDLEAHVQLLTNVSISKPLSGRMPSIPSVPSSPHLNLVDPSPQVATTPPPASPPLHDSPRCLNPITSPNASPIYPRMPLGHAKEATTENEQGKAKERVDMPLLKFPAVPTPSRSPPSPRHAAPVTPKVVDVSQAVVELLESVKAWETKGHSDSTTMSHLGTALQLVMTLASENAGNRTKIRKLGGIEISMRILSTSGSSSSSRSSSSELIVVDMALLELIHSLSWEDNTALLRQTSLSPIITRMTSSDPQVRKLALAIIRNLSSQDENESLLVAQGALHPLLQLLDARPSIDVSLRIEVLKTIRNLSFAPESRVELKKCNGLDSIVRHLIGVPNHAEASDHKRRECEECLEVRRMAIRVVSIISGDTDIRKAVRNFDGIKMVIECLDDSEMDTVRSAVGTLLNISVNDKNKHEIVKCGGIVPLVRTISHRDLEIRRFTLRAMLNLVASDDACNVIAHAAGSVPALSACLKDGDLTVKRTTLRCLCPLATVPRFRIELAEVSGLPSIIACLHSQDEDILKHSIILVGLLLVQEETRRQLSRHYDGSAVVIQVLEQCKQCLQQQPQQLVMQQQTHFVGSCVKILDVLTASEDVAYEISARKGVNTLQALVTSSKMDPDVYNPVFSLLHKLSSYKRSIQHFSDEFVKWVITLLMRSPPDPVVVKWAVSIVRPLAELPNNKNSFRTSSGITSLVAILRDPVLVHLREDVLATIASLSIDVSCAVDLTHQGVITSLVACLADTTVRLNAITTLANLTSHTKLHEMMCEKQEAFATSFPFGPPRMMATLSLEKNASGLSAIFVTMVCKKNQEEQIEVLTCIQEANREEFLRQGGLEPLLRSLNGRDVQTVRLAIRAVCLLTTDASTRQLMGNNASLHYIHTCIKSSDIEVTRSALGALVNLSLLPRVKTSVNIPLLADCLTTTSDKECVRYSILCLKNLSSVEANKKVMQGANVVGKLVARVWDGAGLGGTKSSMSSLPLPLPTTSTSTPSMASDPEILRIALGTLSRLVDCEGIDDEFREQGGIDLILHSITLPDPQLRRNALKLLYNVTKNNVSNQMAVTSKRGQCHHILSCLSSSNVHTKKHALKCLALLTTYGDCRAALQTGIDLVIESKNGEDPVISKLASVLLEVYDQSYSSVPSPSPYLSSLPRESRDYPGGNVHVNTFRY